MWNFVRQLEQRVRGVLSGFDRLLFRGTLRCVIDPRRLNGYPYGANVSMADYGKHVEEVLSRLKDASLAEARKAGCQSLTALMAAANASATELNQLAA